MCHACSAEKGGSGPGLSGEDMRHCSRPKPRCRHRKGVFGNGSKEKPFSISRAFARRSMPALIMKWIASMRAIKRSISLCQMLIPEKKASGSLAAPSYCTMSALSYCANQALLYCANIATEMTIKGTPQTSQKVVLAKTLLKRCGVVPPSGKVGLATVTLIQAAIARSANAPITSHQKIGLDQMTRIAKSQFCHLTPANCARFRSSRSHVGKSQSRNQFLFDTERYFPARYHSGLKSYAPRRLTSKTRGCQER